MCTQRMPSTATLGFLSDHSTAAASPLCFLPVSGSNAFPFHSLINKSKLLSKWLKCLLRKAELACEFLTLALRKPARLAL